MKTNFSKFGELRADLLGGKLLNVIKSMYVNDLACVIVKWGESKSFRIDSGVREGYIMSLCFLNVYMDSVMEDVKIEIGKRRVNFQEDGRDWILPGLLYADDIVSCRETGNGGTFC